MSKKSNGNGVTLSRTLTLTDITMIGIGAMIGAGIFVLTGIAAGKAGPALPIAFLANGIVTTFTALSYAELGSAFPEAGGGYLWVKVGMGGTHGFLAGWMSWFAHAVACSLYGLGFGRFAVEIIGLTGIGIEGYEHTLTLAFMVAIVALMSYVNYRGASEAGLIGNVVTVAKVIILAVFIGFGIYAMIKRPESFDIFRDNLLPNGLGGVFVAMGLTFIAFEGYEIIAQSGEEVIDPKRNIPRAIFISIAVVVVIYILVAVVAIGAVTPPDGSPIWEYLEAAREVAIVRAAEQLMPYGGLLILISGLASTMSALNATIYSSSRVSFAMGRDSNLPSVFGRIHEKMHTPHMAVFLSAILVVIMGIALPLEHVAAAADVMFLLMFAQVNITVMTLRHRRPDLDRGFFVPFFPWPAVIGVISNIALAVFLAYHLGTAGLVSAGWIVIGILLYWGYFSKKEEMERPKEILLEEALISVDYSVLVPVANVEQAAELGYVASLLAQEHDGGVLALNVIKVPPQLSLSDGRLFLKEGRPPLQKVIDQAKERDVPVHTMIRLGRDIPEAILKTTRENASDLIIFGWPGASSGNWTFGPIIDRVAANPPADIGVLKWRRYTQLHRILVPVAGDPNASFVFNTAVALARNSVEETEIVLLYVAVEGMDVVTAEARANNAFRRASSGSEYPYSTKIVHAENPVNGILDESRRASMIVIGATSERLFQNLLIGNVSKRVAEGAHCPVLVLKRRSTVFRSVLRETILQPIRVSPKLVKMGLAEPQDEGD